jgi:hypothetical protein
MRSLLAGSLVTSLFLVACGAAPPAASTPPEGSAAATGTAAPAKGAELARDPAIVALAAPALACKFEEGYFDEECPAMKAWHENEELFADGKGNDTVFSMLGDPDEKLRVLAADKGIDGSQAYFADKAHATRLFALAKKETSAQVGHDLGGYVAKVDAEKLGLGPDLVALAKQPVVKFREALAFYLISTNQSPTSLEVLNILLEDADATVKENAIGSLSTGGITPGVPPVCELLKKQLARTDDFAGKALWAGSSSKCAGIDDVVIAELEKRVADPTKVKNAVGIGYSLAAGSVCGRTASADLKKKGFAIGVKLTDSKVPDPNTRRSSISVLTGCDPAGAKKVLSVLAKDKDKFVADEAKSTLAKLPKK